MDRDYDGRLSLEEFLGEETPIEKLFKLMDRDGDGFVTKKVKQRHIVFSRFDSLQCSGVPDNLQETEQGTGWWRYI